MWTTLNCMCPIKTCRWIDQQLKWHALRLLVCQIPKTMIYSQKQDIQTSLPLPFQMSQMFNNVDHTHAHANCICPIKTCHCLWQPPQTLTHPHTIFIQPAKKTPATSCKQQTSSYCHSHNNWGLQNSFQWLLVHPNYSTHPTFGMTSLIHSLCRAWMWMRLKLCVCLSPNTVINIQNCIIWYIGLEMSKDSMSVSVSSSPWYSCTFSSW